MNKQNGFVILYAVLLVSIVLTVSLTLLNITLKQLLLSLVARESSYAFYAADSGRGCAQYWDSFYDDTNPFGRFEYNLNTSEYEYQRPSQQSFFCGEGKVNATTVDDGITAVTTFTAVFPVANGERATCANGTVTKYLTHTTDPTVPDLFAKTFIEVRGYNLYDASGNGGSGACPQVSDRATERAINVGPY